MTVHTDKNLLLARSDYVHPLTKRPLFRNEQGDLFATDRVTLPLYKNYGGSYDFTEGIEAQEDKDHYDEVYNHEKSEQALLCGGELEQKIQGLWHGKNEKVFQTLLSSLGELQGKRVLLLGNGMSIKELYFSIAGADVVYTDLSMSAVRAVKDSLVLKEAKNVFKGGSIQFQAINALHMPFPDDSFDVIYGCAFAHHVQEIDALLKEVRRCLKPGGICRFMDDAYSPLWRFLKKSLLYPLQKYSHSKGISPEDLIATHKGGYRFDQMAEIAARLDFENVIYERTSFFEYFLQRGTTKIGGKALIALLPACRAIDQYLHDQTSVIKKQGIRLVWGFQKPRR